MKSIKLILSVVFLLTSQFYAQDNWTDNNTHDPGIKTTINSITFFNADTGIVVGTAGTIYRTVNGGKDWTLIEGDTGSTNISFSPNEILAEDHNSSRSNFSNGDPRDPVIVGGLGMIKRSVNFGLSWEIIPSGTSKNINGITDDGANYSGDIIYAVGDSGLILKSSNNGLTWTQQVSGTNVKLNSVTFFNADTGIAVGNNGTILRTTDGGGLWKAISGGSTNTAFSPNEILAEDHNSSRSNLSQGIGVVVGNGGTILRTTDFGLNWSPVSTGTSSSLLGLAFKDSSLTAVGDNGTVLVSSDFGESWQSETSRTTAQLRAVEIAIKEEGVNRYIGGSGGALFKAAQSQLNIISPSPGDIWYTGTSHTINWSGGNPGWNVLIYLIDVNAWTTYSTLNSTTLNDGSDVWNIPLTIPTGLYQVYVQEVNQTDWKYSGTFTISCNQTVTLTTSIPNGILRFSATQANELALQTFNGALGYASPQTIFNNGSMVVLPCETKTVLLKLATVNFTGDYNPTFNTSDPNLSFGYRYLRAASLPAVKPEFAPHIINPSAGYAYQEFIQNVPFSAWDVTNPLSPQRLAVGFLENNTANGLVDGKYWPGSDQLYQNVTGSGPTREWLFIFDEPYSTTPNSTYTSDILDVAATHRVMYTATWNRIHQAVFSPGTSGEDEFLISLNLVTDVEESQSLPEKFELMQSYPNPFNPSTTIRFKIAEQGFTTLMVYDVLGRVVTTLVNEELSPGIYERTFDAKGLASGIYFYRMQSGKLVQTKKMLLLK